MAHEAVGERRYTPFVTPSFDAVRTQELLASAREGSADAWSEMVRRHRVMLAVLVRDHFPRFYRHRFDTDDVLQATFASAFRGLERFTYRGEGSLRRWLVQLVTNELRSLIRHHSAHKRTPEVEKDSGTQVIDGDDPLESAEHAEELVALLQAVSELDVLDQEIVCARFFDGKTFAELARRTGLPETSVRDRFERALEQLTGPGTLPPGRTRVRRPLGRDE